jgi:hypothetical protein
VISERLHVGLELYVEATNVISQPLIDEVHEALSIRAVEATHHLALPEPRQGFNKLWMRLSVLLSCRAMTSFHASLFEAEVEMGDTTERFQEQFVDPFSPSFVKGCPKNLRHLFFVLLRIMQPIHHVPAYPRRWWARSVRRRILREALHGSPLAKPDDSDFRGCPPPAG